MVVDGLGLRRHGAKTFFFWDFVSLVVRVFSSDGDDLARGDTRSGSVSFGANYDDSSSSEFNAPQGFPYWEEASASGGGEALEAPLWEKASGGGGVRGVFSPGGRPAPYLDCFLGECRDANLK